MSKKAKYIILIFIFSAQHAFCQCDGIYYKTQSCLNEIEVISKNPVVDGCMRWLQSSPTEPYQIKFQNKILIDYPKTFLDTMDFSIDLVAVYFNWAMNYWTSQCQSPGFVLDSTPQQGALIGWEKDPVYFLSNPDEPVMINHSVDSSAQSSVVDSSGCSPSSIRGRTEILFNNSEEFYTRNPHLRWATNRIPPVNKWLYVKLDLQSLILHAAGHYLGLANDYNDSLGIMNPDNVGKIYKLSQCDADKLRMLYCQNEVGNPVSVEESLNENFDEINLKLFPIPNSGFVTIRFILPYESNIMVLLSDPIARTKEIIAKKKFPPGINEIKYPTSRLSDGIYIITLFNQHNCYSKKLIVIK